MVTTKPLCLPWHVARNLGLRRPPRREGPQRWRARPPRSLPAKPCRQPRPSCVVGRPGCAPRDRLWTPSSPNVPHGCVVQWGERKTLPGARIKPSLRGRHRPCRPCRGACPPPESSARNTSPGRSPPPGVPNPETRGSEIRKRVGHRPGRATPLPPSPTNARTNRGAHGGSSIRTRP